MCKALKIIAARRLDSQVGVDRRIPCSSHELSAVFVRHVVSLAVFVPAENPYPVAELAAQARWGQPWRLCDTCFVRCATSCVHNGDRARRGKSSIVDKGSRTTGCTPSSHAGIREATRKVFTEDLTINSNPADLTPFVYRLVLIGFPSPDFDDSIRMC